MGKVFRRNRSENTEPGLLREESYTNCLTALVSGPSQVMFPTGAATNLGRNGSVGHCILEGPFCLLRSRCKHLPPLHQASRNGSLRRVHVQAAPMQLLRCPVGTSFRSESTGYPCPWTGWSVDTACLSPDLCCWHQSQASMAAGSERTLSIPPPSFTISTMVCSF